MNLPDVHTSPVLRAYGPQLDPSSIPDPWSEGEATESEGEVTNIAPGERAANAHAVDALSRLRDLKRSRDPPGVFRSSFPVHD
jgi:hypothetical protein